MNGTCDYCRLSLLELAARIVRDADREAVRQVCERPLFRVQDHERLRLPECLDRFRQGFLDPGLGPIDAHILENAYDLTLDKFTHFPEQERGRASPVVSRPIESRGSGPDCRLYYGAFLKYASRRLEGVNGQLERELGAARLFQILVGRHFALSCLERMRQERRLSRRYAWRVNGHVVNLRMPSRMSAAACRTWLETHIGEPDTSHPAERARIQRVVDDLLGRPVIRRFSELGMRPETVIIERSGSRESILEHLADMGLAEAVAREKAASLGAQRPAIRRLGKARLAEMIRRIFEDLAAGSYSDNVVAREYGLSKATFSRFAGSRWRRPSGNHAQAGMPDLWRNTAQVLGSHPGFVEAARSSGWSSSEQLFEAGLPGDAAEAEPGQPLSNALAGGGTDGGTGPADESRGPTSTGLFFIPIIAYALGEPDVQTALRDVFARIQKLGRSKSHEHGARQFRRFMNAMNAWADRLSSPESEPVEEWMTALGPPDLTRGIGPPELLVFRDDRQIGTITVSGAGGGGRPVEVTVGTYRITSRTGWTLWEGRLTAERLRWSSAFPGRPYEVAAATEETKRIATLTEVLLNGELVLRVFPGVECGRLTVEVGDVH